MTAAISAPVPEDPEFSGNRHLAQLNWPRQRRVGRP
jgi:hypothetical protein